MSEHLAFERRKQKSNPPIGKVLDRGRPHSFPLKEDPNRDNIDPLTTKNFNQFLNDASGELINYANSNLLASQKVRSLEFACEFRKGIANRSIDDYKRLIISEEEIFSNGKKSNKSPIATRNYLLQKDYQKACWLCSLGRYKRIIRRLKAKVMAQFPPPSFDSYKETQSSSFEKSLNTKGIPFTLLFKNKPYYSDDFIRKFFAMSSKTSNLKFGPFGIDGDLESLSK